MTAGTTDSKALKSRIIGHFPLLLWGVVALVAMVKMVNIERSMPTSTPYKIDAQQIRLQQQLNQTNNASERVVILMELAKLYQSAAQYDNAIKRLKSAQSDYEISEKKDPTLATKLTTMLGDVYRDARKYPEADKSYRESLDFHKKNHSMNEAATDLTDLAALRLVMCHHTEDKEDRDSAFDEGNKLLDQAEETTRQDDKPDPKIQRLIKNLRKLFCIEMDQPEKLQHLLNEDPYLWRGG